MTKGAVNARGEPIVRLRVRKIGGGVEMDVDLLVDSGFTASLTLPVKTVTALGLARRTTGTGTLADGSVRRYNVCYAEVSWDGNWRQVMVYELGNQPLMGMRLLAGHKLQIDVVPGSLVEILPLP